MMEGTKDIFLNATNRIFSNWTALKLAVEHGMGTVKDANEFCKYITEVMYTNDKLCISEIQDVLEDYMDEVFNTELQDLSGQQVANELLKFYQHCAVGDGKQAAAELDKMPPLQTWILTDLLMKCEKKSVEVESSSSDSEDEDVKKNMQSDIMEWTEVKYKRKK